MEKRSYSPKENEKPKKFSKKAKKTKDPCQVCDGELYLDGEYTQRIGLLNERDDVYGWICPFCKSEFDLEGRIMSLKGQSNISGEA